MNGKMNDLLKRALIHYEELKDNEELKIVKDSYPILYFGDYEEYCVSETKVITVGLNPSYKEFENNKRFPEIKPGEVQLLNYYDAYNNYFKEDRGRDPYWKWFNSYEKILLKEIGCCYSSKKEYANRALHTDICSPLATVSTWSKLSMVSRQDLMKYGVEIWHDLVRELDPDIIICSFANRIREKIQFDEGKPKWENFYPVTENKDGTEKKQEYIVTKAKIKIGDKYSDIFWGNQRDTPFNPISDSVREDIGKQIYGYFDKR